MGVVRVPSRLLVYWDGKYSRCVRDGAIEQYIDKVCGSQISAIMTMSDGFISDSEHDQMIRQSKRAYVGNMSGSEFPSLVASATPNTIPIVFGLCSRGFKHDSFIATPLDDDTFQYGLDAVLRGIPKLDWKDRKPIVFWRGGASGFERPSVRTRVTEALYNHPLADVRITKWSGWEANKNIPEEHFGDRCDLAKHFLHKYILIVDGNCIASNHQWVFGSGSVPIMITHPDNDYWFRKELKPMVNYVPVKYDLSDLHEKIEWLVINDFEARKIAENALLLAKTVFTPEYQKMYIQMEVDRVIGNSASFLTRKYYEKCHIPSDIHEHLPTLYEYTKKCKSVVECGVRHICSSYAFANALKNIPGNSFTMIDPYKSDSMDLFVQCCRAEGVNASFLETSDIACPPKYTDLLFIDTWHVYGQLKRELAHWHEHVGKYIILHDTTVDEWLGETIRCRLNAEQQSRDSGIPVDEIKKGLWPAVEEFLKEHIGWVIEKRYTNNNGLTILARV